MHLFLRKFPYLLMCVFGLVCIQCTNKHKAQLNFPENRWYQTNVLSLEVESFSLNKKS